MFDFFNYLECDTRFYLTDEECKCWMVSKLQLKGRGFYLTDEECKCKYGVPVEVVVPVFI